MTALRDQATDIRPIELPPLDRPLMRQTWRDVSFAHWPVDPASLRCHLPERLEIDEFDGAAWISLVGFEMEDLRLRGLPTIPTTGRFPEFNVRTYVVGRHGPGVWFFSLDTPNLLPTLVARASFALPYCLADVHAVHSGPLHSWSVRRRWPGRHEGALSVLAGDPIREPSTLDHFLTARWRLYARTRLGDRMITAPVHHERWPLHAATLIDVDAGLAVPQVGRLHDDPLLHHAPAVSVSVGRPRWA